ncbi:unnamed protein product, partial [Brassica rapa subsp. narinosa]
RDSSCHLCGGSAVASLRCLVDLTSNCRRSQAAAAKLANLTSISSEGLMVDRLRLFTSSCSLVSVMVEVDRILRPQETFIVNDGMEKIGEIEKMMESLKWNVRMTHSRYGEGVISVQKSWWRPTEVETITSAISSERELV